MRVRITGLAALAHGAAQKFEFERDGERREGFVLRFGTELFAYHNRCPHWGVDLDMGDGRFFSSLTNRIFCSSHGALFVPSTGYCELGPCVGSSLEAFGLELDDDGDGAWVTIADVDPDPR